MNAHVQLVLSFDDPPKARRSDPATSHAAAKAAKVLQGEHNRKILNTLARFGPAGKCRIARLAGIEQHAVGKRLSELERAGLAEPTGDTVASDSGRQEREWRWKGRLA